VSPFDEPVQHPGRGVRTQPFADEVERLREDVVGDDAVG
jgi:hypothetical protein